MPTTALTSVLIVAAVIVAASLGAPDPEPSPDLSPAEVVRIQVEALGRADLGGAEPGEIAVAWRFASPANQSATGPLDRFAEMVRGPVYAPLLDHERASYGPVMVEGDQAAQGVTLTLADGRRAAFVFVLRRQSGGAFDGCWMTEAVAPAEPDDDLTRV